MRNICANNGNAVCAAYCTYYIVAMEIVWKQTPAICKIKCVYFFLTKQHSL